MVFSVVIYYHSLYKTSLCPIVHIFKDCDIGCNLDPRSLISLFCYHKIHSLSSSWCCCCLRYKAELKRRQSGAAERQSMVPASSEPADESTSSRLPDIIVDPDIVFLCRYVYDVKLHRILKNPPAHSVAMWRHLAEAGNCFSALLVLASQWCGCRWIMYIAEIVQSQWQWHYSGIA